LACIGARRASDGTSRQEQLPSGKLSFTWPHSIADIPVKMGDKNYNPLFPYGYGLTY
jgi:hypothetical protein